MNIQDARPCYCGEVAKETSCITHTLAQTQHLSATERFKPTIVLLKSHLVKHLVQRRLGVRLSGAAGQNGETRKNRRLNSGFIMSHLKKRRTKIVFFTESRVSRQRVGSFCDNLFQSLAEEFGNTPAWKMKEVRTFTEQLQQL